MKSLNYIRFAFILILCAMLTSCDDDDPVVCNNIAIHDGNEQLGIRGEALPLQVKVTDAAGQPVANTKVSWEVVEGEGTLNSSTSTTNAQGIAEASWTYGAENGKVRATAENHSDCTTKSVEFTAQAVQLTLLQEGSKIQPKRLRSNKTCYEYDFTLAYNSNVDLSQYYIDVKGEYQFESESKPTSYFKMGILDAENKTISYMDCFTFESERYIDDWFTVALYHPRDVQNGKIVAGSIPIVISNRMGPMRTMKPDGAPRYAGGSPTPGVASRGN